MAHLIDTSLWVDLLRAATPQPLKRFAGSWVEQRETRLAEPIVFELMRYASDSEVREFQAYMQTVPMLETPADIWRTAADLGRACRRQSNLIKALDLLIAAVALHHEVEVITFDSDYEKIAKASPLKVRLLKRLPTSPT
jgi:predicted nucleic acid-binding protein